MVYSVTHRTMSQFRSPLLTYISHTHDEPTNLLSSFVNFREFTGISYLLHTSCQLSPNTFTLISICEMQNSRSREHVLPQIDNYTLLLLHIYEQNTLPQTIRIVKVSLMCTQRDFSICTSSVCVEYPVSTTLFYAFYDGKFQGTPVRQI